MKLNQQCEDQNRRSAFTLVEAIIVIAIMVVLTGAVIMATLYGMSMNYREQIWLSSGSDAAQTLGVMTSDIRAAQYVWVGSGSNYATWASAGSSNTTLQQGNSMMIYLTANSNAWVMYYFDPGTSNLWRTNYTGSNYGDYKLVSANPITTNNNYVFTETDYLGNTLTGASLTPTPLVNICLAFTKLQNPQIAIAPDSPVDFYQLVTSCAPRSRN